MVVLSSKCASVVLTCRRLNLRFGFGVNVKVGETEMLERRLRCVRVHASVHLTKVQ